MTYHPKTNRPRKGYSNPEKLIAMYRYMQEYFRTNQRFPTNREMVERGFATSTSVIRFYYDHMERFHMLSRDPMIARGLHLYPLSRAHPAIRDIIEKEKSNVSA